jgi:hypothetical protein
MMRVTAILISKLFTFTISFRLMNEIDDNLRKDLASMNDQNSSKSSS